VRNPSISSWEKPIADVWELLIPVLRDRFFNQWTTYPEFYEKREKDMKPQSSTEKKKNTLCFRKVNASKDIASCNIILKMKILLKIFLELTIISHVTIFESAQRG